MRDLMGTTAAGLSRGGAWTLVGLRLALACFFVFVAARNLAGDAQMAADFQRWGYPTWFRPVVALMQAAGALLLVWSGTAPYGAALLTVVMVGAVSTHLLHDPPVSALVPLVFLATVVVVVVMYRPAALR